MDFKWSLQGTYASDTVQSGLYRVHQARHGNSITPINGEHQQSGGQKQKRQKPNDTNPMMQALEILQSQGYLPDNLDLMQMSLHYNTAQNRIELVDADQKCILQWSPDEFMALLNQQQSMQTSGLIANQSA